jgi:NADH-quinone oxidoreductase subunit M
MGFGAIAALGVILGAVYMLHMVARVIFGPLKTPGDHGDGHGAHAHTDINGREMAILIPLAILVIVVGVIPNAIMRPIFEPIQKLHQLTPAPAEEPVALAAAH